MDSLMQEASSYGTSFQVSPYRVLGSARARATRPDWSRSPGMDSSRPTETNQRERRLCGYALAGIK